MLSISQFTAIAVKLLYITLLHPPRFRSWRDDSKLYPVKEQFETRKKHFFSSYHGAYMSLGVVSIFSLYVRLELLKWDLLLEESVSYNMQWYTTIPILHPDIAHCWDMLSTRGTKNGVPATTLVITYAQQPLWHFRICLLLETLESRDSRIPDAVANLSVATWSTVVIKAVPDVA